MELPDSVEDELGLDWVWGWLGESGGANVEDVLCAAVEVGGEAEEFDWERDGFGDFGGVEEFVEFEELFEDDLFQYIRAGLVGLLSDDINLVDPLYFID